MKFTLGGAAKRLGLSKPTVGKHIKNGRLAGTKNSAGIYEIDAAELARFEAEYRRVPPAGGADVEPVVVAGDVALAVEREKARQLEERLAETAARLAAAEARADAAQARADEAMARMVGLLEGPKQAWWSRLIGRG
jgi:uncharacterized protein YaiL (DUF2058 family)